MSVLLEFAMFPIDKAGSVSEYVGRVVSFIRSSGYNYKLTSMGTIVETENLPQALELIEKSHNLLVDDCGRVYCTAKFDINSNRTDCMQRKIESVKNKIGEVNT